MKPLCDTVLISVYFRRVFQLAVHSIEICSYSIHQMFVQYQYFFM